jgi:diguanylate cyclase (GGDEF)-like protein
MKITARIYFVIGLGLLLLVLPLFVGNRAINTATGTIEQIKSDQLHINTLTHEIGEGILHQQTMLMVGLMEDEFKTEGVERLRMQTMIGKYIEELSSLLHQSDGELKQQIDTLRKRLVGFRYVEASLIEAKRQGNDVDFQDALIGYQSVSDKVLQDVHRIQTLSDDSLRQAVDKAYQTVLNACLFIIGSFVGALILMLHAFYTLFRLNREYRSQWRRAAAAEAAEKKLKEQLRLQAESLEEVVRRKTAEITERYYHHPLTQLPNRFAFLERSDPSEFGHVALFNLDRFQEFNDTLGEGMGNQALVACAAFFSEHLPAHCALFHIGGDEYLIAGNKHLDCSLFEEEMIEIHDHFNRSTFTIGDEAYYLSCSVGIYHGETDQIARADTVLKEAKRLRKGYLVYSDSDEIAKRYENNRHYSTLLIDALKQRKLVVYLQPIFTSDSESQICRYEALVRLKDQDGTVILPGSFLQIARRLRLNAEMTDQILQQVLSLIEQYNIVCSVNISIEDLQDTAFFELIERRFETFQYNANLTFEILESDAIDDYENANRFIEMLHKYGAQVALDDFGSGYSNFTHILNLPVDIIKIDGSLIRDLDQNAKSRLMVETIVKLAGTLGVKTVAEFVSSEVIAERCRQLGIDFLQGFWLAKPDTPEMFIKEFYADSAPNRTIVET